MNVHEFQAQEVVRQLEELDSRFDCLLEKLSQDSGATAGRLELTHLYSCLKQDVKGEAHRLSLSTINRDLTEIQRDYLVPTVRQVADALATPVNWAPSKWLPDIRCAQSYIRATLTELAKVFPEQPVAAVDRLQRELLERCQTKARSRLLLIDALRRTGHRKDADQLARLFTEFYDRNGSPRSTECVDRQADIIREGAVLKGLSSAFRGEE